MLMQVRLGGGKRLARWYSVLHTQILAWRSWRQRRQDTQDCPIIHVHIPKTAGKSIRAALRLPDQGHFAYELIHRSRRVPVTVIVVSVRDPIDRLRSMFKFVHMYSHTNSLWIFTRFSSLEAFVMSAVFSAFVEHHYFVMPQSRYLRGLSLNDPRLKLLRCETLQADAARELGITHPKLPHLNCSDALPADRVALSAEAVARVRMAYAEDYALLARLRRGGDPS